MVEVDVVGKIGYERKEYQRRVNHHLRGGTRIIITRREHKTRGARSSICILDRNLN